MFNIKIVFLLLGLMNLVNSGLVPFLDCGSTYELKEVDIEGCNRLPCDLIAGTQQRITMKLYTKSVSQRLTQNVNLILRGIHIPLKVSPENPCDQIICPVISKHNASFSAIMDLDSEELTAQLDGDLRWIMKNDKNLQVLCMVTKVYVKLYDYRNDILDFDYDDN